MERLFQVQQANFLRNASFSRNYGIGIEQLHSGNYAFDEYIKADALEYLDVKKIFMGIFTIKKFILFFFHRS